jgi:hypothetical protein
MFVQCLNNFIDLCWYKNNDSFVEREYYPILQAYSFGIFEVNSSVRSIINRRLRSTHLLMLLWWLNDIHARMRYFPLSEL